MLRSYGRAFAFLLAVALTFALPAETASPRQLRWEELTGILGRTVSVVLPGAATIVGEVTGIDSNALFVTVKKTSDPRACPKGALRIPRASLHVSSIQGNRTFFRWLLTGAGAFGGHFCGERRAQTYVAPFWAGIVGGALAGYWAGNKADRRWTVIQILP